MTKGQAASKGLPTKDLMRAAAAMLRLCHSAPRKFSLVIPVPPVANFVTIRYPLFRLARVTQAPLAPETVHLAHNGP